MAYSAIAVANAFIERAKQKGITDLSPMKLQKLVYFAHAWMLALDNKPLIKDPVNAWKFGPVIKSVYHEFKSYGSKNITSPGTEFEVFDSDDGVIDAGFIIPEISKSDTKANDIIDAVMDIYGNKSAIFLSNLTHAPGSAWCETKKFHKDGQEQGFVIDNNEIKKAMILKLGL
ncbi:SocA family protein [Hafnia alvei]|uniref:Panacea domain-containing protein n=1 Tax=Hafnia alvei TaxID=569 RepID=UPI000B75CEA0|nr:type II toxin-antitoxin system antitoxin SocA domain-containing protein [Hafnia alvei]MBI0275645.1 SocA family protein [Hafnia alvei]MBI0275699.1 SocA family protein [Hafnia alvei]PNK93102.1 hypothetical protein CEQ28_023440 [Hafnia alvei]PNK98367.1 hypothetical protein CEQ28_012665 [Hafnia alvei]